MATPTLPGLPIELFNEIISLVLPEGFESLALTCKGIHKLCVPFIERHNLLRSHFRRFKYGKSSKDPLSSGIIRSAFDLLKRIAIEPLVARYIIYADFTPLIPDPQLVPDVHDGGPFVSLFADSPYLEQAGLDWKEYYALIATDYNYPRRAIESATAFVLTLLPNVRTFKLPSLWSTDDKTIKLLLYVIALVAKRPNPPWINRSLAQLTRFESLQHMFIAPIGGALSPRFDLDEAIPFLTLPRVRSFRGHYSISLGDDYSMQRKGLYDVFGPALELETALFWCSRIDEIAMAEFLRRTPRLRTLIFNHELLEVRDNMDDWHVGEFVSVIEREAGDRLEGLSLSLQLNRSKIIPGMVSMRRFRRLRKLEFDLELVVYDVADTERYILETGALSIGDIVPASVSQLSLISYGDDGYEKVLEVLFSGFAAKKKDQLPALEEIYLSCPEDASDPYKEECAKLVRVTEQAGVALHLSSSYDRTDMKWEWK
ncbi:F-box domain protein [Hypoxylon sp. NC1633]|nr:F-box domain protein [Hypoxylon sp. NC1633]